MPKQTKQGKSRKFNQKLAVRIVAGIVAVLIAASAFFFAFL